MDSQDSVSADADAGLVITPFKDMSRDGDEPLTATLVREVAHRDNSAAFPLVALGGSAGSLVAFEQFFRAMPADTGMAFVVVTHLSPDHDSELAQVVQHFTKMKVQEATDGLRVRPNEVYIIPPNRDMRLLLLFMPTQPVGRRLPIDFFFQSLAKDARDRAVCIVCSGLGTDGTLGLKMVMENFGMVMVQDPTTAEFDGMPRSALATEVCGLRAARRAVARQAAGVRAPPRHPPPPPGGRKPRQARARAAKKSSASSGRARGTTSAFTSATPCSGALSGAWARTRLGNSRTTRGFCRKTRPRWMPCSRSC